MFFFQNSIKYNHTKSQLHHLRINIFSIKTLNRRQHRYSIISDESFIPYLYTDINSQRLAEKEECNFSRENKYQSKISIQALDGKLGKDLNDSANSCKALISTVIFHLNNAQISKKEACWHYLPSRERSITLWLYMKYRQLL